MSVDDDHQPFIEKRDAKYRDLRQVVEESKDRRRAGKAHLYALEIPMSVIVGAVAGKFADDHFGIAPWGIGIGLIAGVGAAIRSVVNLIGWMKINDAEDETDAAKKQAAQQAAQQAEARDG